MSTSYLMSFSKVYWLAKIKTNKTQQHSDSQQCKAFYNEAKGIKFHAMRLDASFGCGHWIVATQVMGSFTTHCISGLCRLCSHVRSLEKKLLPQVLYPKAWMKALWESWSRQWIVRERLGRPRSPRHCGLVACFLNRGISKLTLRDAAGEVRHFNIVLGWSLCVCQNGNHRTGGTFPTARAKSPSLLRLEKLWKMSHSSTCQSAIISYCFYYWCNFKVMHYMAKSRC